MNCNYCNKKSAIAVTYVEAGGGMYRYQVFKAMDRNPSNYPKWGRYIRGWGSGFVESLKDLTNSIECDGVIGEFLTFRRFQLGKTSITSRIPDVIILGERDVP